MSPPYGVISDIHLHEWSAFAGVDKEGRNTRLMHALREVDRCCQAVLDAGGDTVIVAGDVFHTRGSVKPTVFNPAADCFRSWSENIRFLGIPGNHDLASKDSRKLTSAVEMLSYAANMTFFHEPTVHKGFAFVPWFDKQEELLAAIGKVASRGALRLVIHAGIDGVLSGVPDHGLTAAKLADFGFKSVVSGHYHHAKDMGQNVWSIGSATMQTWSDIGTKAGWLLVSDTEVKWQASHAPSFIEITAETEVEDLPLIVDGHYVRARIGKATAAEVAKWRSDLMEMGAQGVLIESVPAAVSVRTGSVIGKLATLPAVVNAYCEEQSMSPAVAGMCQDILAGVVA